MLHTIISWDCSFRNFFHLIDGLLVQNFPKDKFELIYVEQRTKKHANSFTHKLGLKSLEDRYNEVKNKISMTIIYLNHSEKIPYHLGLCANKGIKLSRGEIISVMDGDQLLPPDFLIKLSNFHSENKKAVVNLYRKSSAYPIGVTSFENWMSAEIDFKKCLNACSNKYLSVPKKPSNFGPMVSVRREFWEAIGGYDTNPIWSTVLTKCGLDVNTRLEIVTGKASTFLPKTFSVHPWHPVGGGALRSKKDAQFLFSLQELLINCSVTTQKPSVNDRKHFANRLFNQNTKFIRKMLKINEGKTEDLTEYNLKTERKKCSINKAKNLIKAILKKFYIEHIIKKFRALIRKIFKKDPFYKELIKNGIVKYDKSNKTYIREVMGNKFHLNPLDIGISRVLAKNGIRENESVDALYKYVNRDMTILDLGANIGFYVILEAQIVSNGIGRIIALEPGPENLRLLKLNVKANNYEDYVDIYFGAICDSSGTVQLELTNAFNSCHLVKLYRSKNSVGTIDVPAFTFYDFLKHAGITIEQLNFLRMDIEGAEYEIFPDIIDMIKNKTSFLMFIEFHPNINRFKHKEILKKLESMGFICLTATKEYPKDGKIIRTYRPNTTIKQLYTEEFFLQPGGCEVFLKRG